MVHRVLHFAVLPRFLDYALEGVDDGVNPPYQPPPLSSDWMVVSDVTL